MYNLEEEKKETKKILLGFKLYLRGHSRLIILKFRVAGEREKGPSHLASDACPKKSQRRQISIQPSFELYQKCILLGFFPVVLADGRRQTKKMSLAAPNCPRLSKERIK